MRIARVLTRLNLGGPARQVLASDPLLRARGFAVRVLAGEPEPGEGDLTPELEAAGIEVVRVPGLGRSLRPLRDWRAMKGVARELAAFRPDVVHTHASKAGFTGRRAAFALGGARTVHTFHGHVLEGYFPPTTSWLLARLEERLARRTDRIVAVSEATADDLARLRVADRARITVCPPGIDLAPFLALAPLEPDERAPRGRDELRRRLGVPDGAPLVLMIGRLAPIKRPELGLAVFARAAAEIRDAHLAFVGDGVVRPWLEARRAKLPRDVGERVHFAGAVRDMPSVHAAGDVVLLTSRNEGCPVALIEAAAAARPVVATAVGGVAELVRNGVTGLLAAEEDGLCEALASLLADARQRRRFGDAARERVAARHSAAALADRLEGLYRGLIQSEP